MTREEAIEWLIQIQDKYIHDGDEQFDAKRKEALNMAIDALEGTDTHECVDPTHACDSIKRQDAIDAAVEAADEWDGGYSRSREEIITLKLRMLPSAQPERKMGKWVHSTVYTDNRGCEFAKCKCSNCGHEEFAISYNVTHGKYCPNCGARMKEGEDDENDRC